MVLVLIFMFTLTSCIRQTQRLDEGNPGIMRVVDDTAGYVIYVDIENGVMYFCRRAGSSVTAMYEPDGNIKVHPDWK